jgi:hypothetical protein
MSDVVRSLFVVRAFNSAEVCFWGGRHESISLLCRLMLVYKLFKLLLISHNISFIAVLNVVELGMYQCCPVLDFKRKLQSWFLASSFFPLFFGFGFS